MFRGKHYGFPYVFFGNMRSRIIPTALSRPTDFSFSRRSKPSPAGLLGDHPMYSLAAIPLLEDDLLSPGPAT